MTQKKKHIYIDGQIFQTGALERGMGILTLEIVRSYIAEYDARVTVIINPNISMTSAHIERMGSALKGIDVKQVPLDIPNTGLEIKAKQQLESFIERNTHKNEEAVYFIPALFLFDYFVVVPNNATTILFFHDLIPIVMWEYLKNIFPGNVYFERFHTIYEVDKILANSYNTKNELTRLLGVDAAKIAVANGAGERFILDSQEAEEIVAQLGITHPYVLLPTGGGHMHHKNNLRAVQAAGVLRRDLSTHFNLIATSRYESFEKDELRLYVDDIQFTGNVDHRTIQALYMCADTVLMPSLAEGLGLPLMNAITLGKPVACSDIPVFSEISNGTDAIYTFNPKDVFSIRDALLAALSGEDFENKKKAYAIINDKYTWRVTASQFQELIEMTYIPTLQEPGIERLAIFSPDPLVNQYEGYFAQAFAAFCKRHSIAVEGFIDPGLQTVRYDARGVDYIRSIVQTYDAGDTEKFYSTQPALLFLSEGTNYPQIELQARAIDGAVVSISGFTDNTIYNVFNEIGIVNQEIARAESDAHKLMEAESLYGAPLILSLARAVITTDKTDKVVRDTLARMKKDIPILNIGNYDFTLEQYAQSESVQKTMESVLDFVRRAYEK